MSLPLGDIEEKYQLLHKLAEGGMGEVYKVRHRLLDEIRVIKVVNPVNASNNKARQRFEQEAKAAIQLRHPNIAQVLDYVTGEQGSYLVLEFIDGATFKQILKSSGVQALGLTLEMARQSLEALGYLHGRGYLHRDVAPDNLMLCRGPSGEPLVKLIDLGLAKRPEDRIDLTGTNMFVGKVRYSSPEIFRNSKDAASPTTDLYSFGVVLYELLTGECPVKGTTFEELATAHLLEPPISFDITDPESRVPSELREIVLRTLDKQPAARPESAASLAELLTPFQDDGPWPLPYLGEHAPSISADESTIDSPNPLSGLEPTVDETPKQNIGSTVEIAEGDATHRDVTLSNEGPQPGWRRALSRWFGLLLAVALASAFGWWLLSSSEEVPAVSSLAPAPALGRLIVDAVPWARITSVNDADGRLVSIGEARDTPTVLSLPVGEYWVHLEHPSFPPSEALQVTVPEAGTARLRPSLGALDVDAFFESAELAEVLSQAGEGEAGTP